MKLIAGVDEAGRGPLAGPVVASAVILPEDHSVEGIKDSKRLSPKKRKIIFDEINNVAVSIGIGIVHENEIDRINILQATYKAMRIALGRLKPQPEMALIDGRALPDQIVKNEGVVGGDDKIECISAASIIAKVTRDRIMENYDIIFPEYKFAKNKGYGTKSHLNSLKSQLACPIHRKSFNPVINYMPSLSYLKKNHLLGRVGEQIAARELIHKGYTVLSMNYKANPYGEIDIVARNNGTTVFVEVKTATQKKRGDPELRIDNYKIAKLEKAFGIFQMNQESETNYRFDIMTVFLGKGNPIIKHFVDCLN